MQISGSGSSALTAMLQKLQQAAQQDFTTADADKDGKLSKSEFSTLATAMQSTGGSAAASIFGGDTSSDDLFTQLDADGDGSVSSAELTSGLQGMANDTFGALFQTGQDLQNGSAFATMLSGSDSSSSNNGMPDMSSLIQQLIGNYQKTADNSTDTSSLLSSLASL